jgi:flagellar hook-associated protein 3 FlgL
MVSIGDLAQSFQMRRDNARLSVDLNRLAGELSSGRVQDVTDRLRGNFGILSSIERGIARAGSFETSISEARLETKARQQSIESIRTLGEGISGALLLVNPDMDPVLIGNASRDASTRMDSVLNLLNTQVADRSLFSGVDVTGTAVADKETILAALESEIALAGAVTADDVISIVNDWFGPGGGFEALGYAGAPQDLAALRISDSEVLPPPPKADDLRIRDMLSAFSLAALVDRGVPSGGDDERALLARAAGESLLFADRRMVGLQAEIGESESQIERAQAEVAAETDGLILARSDMIAADPFETATELEAVETQLRTLYAVTAKLSGLSLTDYF